MASTYDNELTLIKKTVSVIPPGVSQVTETKTTVLCNVKSATRMDKFLSRKQGLSPSKIFTIHRYEFGGETELEFEGVRYSVIKEYSVGIEETELTCERVTGSGN